MPLQWKKVKSERYISLRKKKKEEEEEIVVEEGEEEAAGEDGPEADSESEEAAKGAKDTKDA